MCADQVKPPVQGKRTFKTDSIKNHAIFVRLMIDLSIKSSISIFPP